MARKLTVQGKALATTAALLFIWWLAPLIFKSTARVTFFEFQAPSWTALSYLQDLQDFWGKRSHSKNELIQAGVDLARLNASYELSVQRSDQMQAELAALETLLSLPRLPEYRYEIARVIRRDMNAWWHRLTIRKGQIHGIEVGQAVVYSGGVVGRVVEVRSYTSVVQMLSSPNFRVAAHLEGDLRPMQFQGGANQPLLSPRAFLENVPPDVELAGDTGLRVVSSRLGGVFPDGLTLGYIEELEMEQSGLFQAGRVRLDPRLQSLREVGVLIPLLSDQAPAE